jgi:hypothetical protein
MEFCASWADGWGSILPQNWWSDLLIKWRNRGPERNTDLYSADHDIVWPDHFAGGHRLYWQGSVFSQIKFNEEKWASMAKV